MSSKHSIMLGTDGPDGGGGRIITPSAHVLAATGQSTRTSSSTTSGTQHSEAAAQEGDVFITPSANRNAGVSTAAATAHSTSTASFGFGDADISTDELLPSSLDSVASRLPSNHAAPRTLSSSSSSTASFATSPTPAPAPASSASSASTTTTAGLIKPAVSQSMSSLSATFASMMAGGSSFGGKGDDEQEDERKDLEGLMRSLQNGSIAASMMAAGPVAAAAATAATEGPSKLSTCFDLVTSTATRIPLSTIIAASSSSSSASSSGAGGRTFAADSYVVIEPIDWSRHHHDSTFARLTAVNRGADSLDEIALELEAQRSGLEQALDKERQQSAEKDRVIAQQRHQIETLQRQLREASSSSITRSTATSAPASSKAVVTTTTAASRENESEEEEEEDDDIDQGMDEEDSGPFNRGTRS